MRKKDGRRFRVFSVHWTLVIRHFAAAWARPTVSQLRRVAARNTSSRVGLHAVERADAEIFREQPAQQLLAKLVVARGRERERAKAVGVGLALLRDVERGFERGEQRGQRGNIAGDLS